MIKLRRGNVFWKKKKKIKLKSRSRLLLTARSLETAGHTSELQTVIHGNESRSTHHARFDTVACMCYTHSHTHTHTRTFMHPSIRTQASFIYRNIKLRWVLRSQRDDVHRYKVKCINQSHQCVFFFFFFFDHLQWNKQDVHFTWPHALVSTFSIIRDAVFPLHLLSATSDS